jgi:cbb3-type cytochrome oxidase subunit 3
MRLSDIMGAADLSIYAEVGLVLFLLAFVGVMVRVYQPKNDREHKEALMLPLEDEMMPAGSAALDSAATETDR